MKSLQRLHVRVNKLTALNAANIFSQMGKLEYINLRENQIADLKLDDFAYARALRQVNM